MYFPFNIVCVQVSSCCDWAESLHLMAVAQSWKWIWSKWVHVCCLLAISISSLEVWYTSGVLPLQGLAYHPCKPCVNNCWFENSKLKFCKISIGKTTLYTDLYSFSITYPLYTQQYPGMLTRRVNRRTCSLQLQSYMAEFGAAYPWSIGMSDHDSF